VSYSDPVRITGGTLRGRVIRIPGDKARLRPSQDRVREALFSILGECVVGCRFLDLFAGSGAVGLEAASRGAARVTWVERNARSLGLLRRNIAALGCEGDAIRADAIAFLRRANEGERRFDIAFADPPYALGGNRDTMERMLALGAGIVDSGGLFVLEQGGSAATGTCARWEPFDRRRYGDTKLTFYRRLETAGDRTQEKGKGAA